MPAFQKSFLPLFCFMFWGGPEAACLEPPPVAGCLGRVAIELTESGWTLKSPPAALDASKKKALEQVTSTMFRRAMPSKAGGQTFPRFRVDEIVFRDGEPIPGDDGQPVQEYGQKSPTSSQYPAQETCLSGSGMDFSKVQWNYHYAMTRAFRVRRRVYVTYTDSAAFLKLMEPFSEQLQESILRLCGPPKPAKNVDSTTTKPNPRP